LWAGEKVASIIQGRAGYVQVPLRSQQGQVTNLTVDQIQAFNETKDRIGRTAGIYPHFVAKGVDHIHV